MVAILWTNPLMAVSSTEYCGTLGTNYAENSIISTSFCIFQRPIFCIALQSHRTTRKNRVNCSLEKGVIEKKEFEFEPSFEEYLKAMESVKTRRAKRPQSSSKRSQNVELKVTEGKDSDRVVVEERKIDDSDLNIQVENVVDKNKTPLRKLQDSNSINKSIFTKNTKKSKLLDVERAAFKTMEEHNSIYDQPRVTRMDKEERIQKLAKCLNGADIEMPEWMFSKIMRSAKIKFSDYSMLRIIQILGKFGNWRRVLQVIEWIQSHDRFKSHKIRYIYTTAIDVLGKSRRPVEALNLYRAMQQHMSSYPDLVAYHSIAVTLGQAGHMKELFDVIDNMRSPPKKKFKAGISDKWDPCLEPDIVVYNSVLNACVRCTNWEGAFWVLQQLQQQGQQPSSTTYGLVMEVMYACGRYNLVHDFFRKMQKSCIPNALTYRVLLKTFSKEGKINEAILAVEEMERRGIVGTASLYYELACCLCSAGRCQEALMQIDKICKVASKPLVVTYTGLIQACLSSGGIQNGAYIFNHMQKFCSPNLVTYNIMLKAFLDHGMFEEAKELFFRLLANIQSISRKLDYKDKVIPDLYTFNLMLDACLAEQKWEDLEFVYVNMLKYGYHFNAKRHLRMILDACRAGKVEPLETTWKHLIHEDRIPPPQLVKEMFLVKLQQGNCSEALSYFASYPSIDSKAFSRKWWLKFFTENANSLEKHCIVQLMDALNLTVAKTEAQAQIFQNLKISCEEFSSKRLTSAELPLMEPSCAAQCKAGIVK